MGCSFCGGEGTSREHIYSNSVLKVFWDDAPFTVDPIRKKVHKGDPIIKDICRNCNSKMSYLDTYAGIFAEKHCKKIHQLPFSLNINSKYLKKWCLKTASNMERMHNRGRLWWKDFYPAFLDESIDLNFDKCSVYLAPWENKSPIPQGGILEGLSIRVLDFYDANVRYCYSIQSNNDGPSNLYSLKIGSLVFLICIWEENKDRSFLNKELNGYGWENLNSDFVSLKKIPFNTWTSDLIGMIHDPSKIYNSSVGGLIDLPKI